MTIFDVQSRKLLRQLKGGMVSFSVDGEQLLVPGSKGNSVEFFDVQTGQLLRSFNTGPRTPRRLAISGNGQLLAGVDGEAAIHVWDMQTGERISDRFSGHLDTPYEIRFTPDGQQIVTGSIDGTIRVWNAVTGKQVHVLNQGAYVTGLAVSGTGNLIASCGTDDSVRLWDLTTGKERFKLPGHGREGGPGTTELAFSPDGERFFSFGCFGGDAYLRSYNVGNGRIMSEHQIQTTGQATPADAFGPSVQDHPTFTPDARILMLGNNDRGTIRFIDVATGKEGEVYRPEGGFNVYTPSPDGKRLATFQRTSLQLRDFGSKKIIRELELKARYGNGGVFSPNSALIAFTVWEQAETNPRCWLLVSGVETLEPVARIEIAPNSIRALAFSPDGTQLAASRDDSTVIVWDLNNFAQFTRHANTGAPYFASLPNPSGVPRHGVTP